MNLDELTVRNGFRERGQDMTRIETFTDAAFAIAASLMVISVSDVPTSWPQLVVALQGIPAFALALLVGVFIGTYSSIYVAANVLIAMGVCKEDLMPPEKDEEEVDDRP